MAKEPMIVAFAAMIARNFPDLEGRSIAVSEVDPFTSSTTKPKLPIAFTALLGSDGVQTSGGQFVKLTDSFVLNFMFEPVKYTNLSGKETSFFAFYDYEALRDRVLSALGDWRTPRGSGVVYKSMDVSSDEFAVYIAFKLETVENWEAWCHGVELEFDHSAKTFSLAITTCSPKTLYCKQEEVEKTDPCPPTVKPVFTAT